MRVGNNKNLWFHKRQQEPKNRKSSFADTLQKTEKASAAKDTVSISQNPLDKRLEHVHKVIDGMDFTGMSAPEIYCSIYDAYENEFGNLSKLCQADGVNDYKNYDIASEDHRQLLKEKLPPYHCENPVFGDSDSAPYADLHYEAMGYDKMTRAEHIAAIEKRIRGCGYTDQVAMLVEMNRANIISGNEVMDLFNSLTCKMEKEYCKAYGLDYLQWQETIERSGNQNGNSLLYQRMMDWANQQKISWIDILDSIKENKALRPGQQDELIESLEGALALPKKQENID